MDIVVFLNVRILSRISSEHVRHAVKIQETNGLSIADLCAKSAIHQNEYGGFHDMKEKERFVKEFVTYEYDSFQEWREHEDLLKQAGWEFERTTADYARREATYSRKVS